MLSHLAYKLHTIHISVLNNPALKYRGYRCDWKSLVSAKAD